MDAKAKEIEKMVENIEWHIKINRDILGDKRTLDDVHASLKNMISYLERTQRT